MRSQKNKTITAPCRKKRTEKKKEKKKKKKHNKNNKNTLKHTHEICPFAGGNYVYVSWRVF